MSELKKGLTRRSLLTKAAIGIPAMGVAGAVAWANPAGAPEAKADVNVDGSWNSDTTMLFQQYYGLPIQDGIVSGQDPSIRYLNPGLGSGWDWSGPSGSNLIRTMQHHMNQWGYGLREDGVLGPQTISHFWVWFGLSPIPYFPRRSKVVKELQRWLNRSV